MSHTPGPWKVRTERSGIEISGGPPYFRAKVAYPRRGASRGMPVQFSPTGCEEANALLIAAAPELLEALREITNHAAAMDRRLYERVGAEDPETNAVLERSYTAIAKATGAEVPA